MRFKTTLIFVIIVLALAIAVFSFLPKGDNNLGPSSDISSAEIVKITPTQFIEKCDTVISGTVIKADVDSKGVLYTFSVDKVYKGRNYASMGYSYVFGEKNLESGNSYLFMCNVGDEKYHYFEPFEGAPWVFEIADNSNSLTHTSNGNIEYCMEITDLTLENIEELCKAENWK